MMKVSVVHSKVGGVWFMRGCITAAALVTALGVIAFESRAAGESTTEAKRRAPFGTWVSPISAAEVARSAIALYDIRVAAGRPYWVETRPADGGRRVVVTLDEAGKVLELTPPEFNARTRVHEYGGTPYVLRGDTLYFSNWSDQRLYRQKPGAPPQALTPAGYRYADCVADPVASRLFCIREDHSGGGEPKNSIVAVSLQHPGAGTVLYGASDFAAYPRVSADGRRLAWIAWNHPNMPWDATTLYVGELVGDGLAGITALAGGKNESVIEPAWDSDGALYFLSDRSNWWNLYRWRGQQIEEILPIAAELAAPLWFVGQANYALTGDGRALFRYGLAAVDRLAILDLKSGELDRIELPFSSYSSVQLLSSGKAIVIAESSSTSQAVVSIDLASGTHRVLRAPADDALDPALISLPELIEFPTEGGLATRAFFYPPTNPRFAAPDGEKPPLLVNVHGGPTFHARPVRNLSHQYWTSRGFALVDVNYGGSSGHGRAYRQRLNGNWGVVDVDAAVAAARHLVKTGRADPDRIAIRGGSAGGFTTLAALAFRDVFKAGANYFGVSDLGALARETHKFESRYLDSLVAPLPSGKAVYVARSPIFHLDGFNEPLITFQGAEDKIVPPSQSRLIVQALQKKHVPVAYIEFAGEQHGFRRAQSIARSTEAELYFYGQIFGFAPADRLEPVEIWQ